MERRIEFIKEDLESIYKIIKEIGVNTEDVLHGQSASIDTLFSNIEMVCEDHPDVANWKLKREQRKPLLNNP